MQLRSQRERNDEACFLSRPCFPSRPIVEESLSQAAQKDPEARRAKNRSFVCSGRLEAYIGSTLTRSD